MRTLAALIVLSACANAASAQQPVASHGTAAPPAPAAHVAARVNGAPIMSDRLDVALGRLIPMESFHRNVSAETVGRLREQALGDLIDEELRYQEGLRLGLTPSNAEVDAALARAVASYKSREAFEEARRRAGASTADLRREIRRSLVISKAYERTVASRCQVNAEEASRFYADNPERFVVPEQLRLYAITVGVDPGAPAQKWTEAKARAEDALRQMKTGAPFEEMARTYSTDKSRERGGDMGLVHRGSLMDEFEQAVRGLKPGDVTPVIQTLYGYHIVRVASIRPPEKRAFPEVAAGIQKDLTTKRCAEMDTTRAARLRAAATIVVTDARSGTASRTAEIPGGRQ